jgi:MFS family permease
MLFYITVKEPKKGATDASPTTVHEAPSFRSVLKLLYSSKVFVFLAIASGLHAFCIYGLFNWTPSFLSRLHGMKNVDIGVSLGLIFGFGGATGTWFGGFLTDYFGKKDKRYYLRIPAYAIFISFFFIAGTVFIRNTSLTLFCLAGCAFLQGLYLGPSIAVAHSLVPANMRALTSAILFLVINLVGLGFGPLVVGLISDLLKPSLRVESLRWAMSILLLVSITAGLLFLRAAKKMVEN